MTLTGYRRFDVDAVRRLHPIEAVVTASGVELTQRGQGFMGCCPFHDDSTASLSVGGVPDRFHCFGCGATGDVIEYVTRFTGLSFVDAVQALEQGTAFHSVTPANTVQVHPPALAAELTTAPERAHEINLLAWEFFTTPTNIVVAESYLRDARGIDVAALSAAQSAAQGGVPVVGYANTDWHALTRRLQGHGVTDSELLELDLAQRTRNGELIDTYRGRLIVPVQQDHERIDGFIGRDITGDPRAPKYRNPTRTPTFNKSTALYRPTHHDLDSDATVVVVEGALDALAIAAAAARRGELSMFAPATTNGVTVSGVQAQSVLALHTKPPVIALDGDRAGREGTDRWLAALCLERSQPALVTRLPDGIDPAEWLQDRGDSGLDAFDRRRWVEANARTDVHTAVPRPQLPSRDLVRMCLDQPGDAVHQVLDALAPLTLRLGERPGRELMDQAEREMTARGWNPDGDFTRALRDALENTQRQPLLEQRRHAMTAMETRSQLSTEAARPDAHQLT